MSWLDRISSFFSNLFGESPVRPLRTSEVTRSIKPRTVVNDATDYGVAIEQAAVTPGAWYWQVVRVHHLTPEENSGNHHIYLDVLDSENPSADAPDGQRVNNARLKVTWDGGEQVVVVDKPANEPGTNFPMWKWQVCAVQALGLPDQELPSDRVTGIHTGHPDEAAGNTLFHHSFGVTFCRVQAPAAVYTDSVIYGVIHNASGRTALLRRNGEVAASQVIGSDGVTAGDGAFRFTDLGAGEYTIAVEGTSLHSDAKTLNGQDQVRVELTLVIAESVISGRVHHGAARTVVLTEDGAETARQAVASDETYRFTGLAAGSYRVAVSGTQVASGVLALDGENSVTADLTAPAEGKRLAQYVLFGQAGQPATDANLLLAQDYLLTFGPTFGFSPTEAAEAGIVTIIADTDAVSSQVEADLAAGGAVVQRLAGNVETVAADLANRIQRGQP